MLLTRVHLFSRLFRCILQFLFAWNASFCMFQRAYSCVCTTSAYVRWSFFTIGVLWMPFISLSLPAVFFFFFFVFVRFLPIFLFFCISCQHLEHVLLYPLLSVSIITLDTLFKSNMCFSYFRILCIQDLIPFLIQYVQTCVCTLMVVCISSILCFNICSFIILNFCWLVQADLVKILHMYTQNCFPSSLSLSLSLPLFSALYMHTRVCVCVCAFFKRKSLLR